MNKDDITLEKLFTIATAKDYKIFDNNGMFDYNLNIWGFRSNSSDTKYYNDVFAIFWQRLSGTWDMELFTGTTKPSDVLLINPVNPDGAAIVVPDQYRKLWSFGFHHNRRDHKALIQFSPIKVYRDSDDDATLDEDDSTIQEGMFGINMHHGSLNGTDVIGAYSAGCQVHEDINRYNNVFIPLIESSVKEGNTTFSYTLCLEDDLL